MNNLIKLNTQAALDVSAEIAINREIAILSDTAELAVRLKAKTRLLNTINTCINAAYHMGKNEP